MKNIFLFFSYSQHILFLTLPTTTELDKGISIIGHYYGNPYKFRHKYFTETIK